MRWTDGELICCLLSYELICFLNPFVASIMAVIAMVVVATWFVFTDTSVNSFRS
jgi:hypothetical protein